MRFNSEDLYEHVGYLFYAIACEGTKLSAGNLLKLNQFIDETWRQAICGDVTLSKYLADCIHNGVRFASVNGMSSDHALESFTRYFIIHSPAFGLTMREKIHLSAEMLLKEFPNNPKAGDMAKNIESLLIPVVLT